MASSGVAASSGIETEREIEREREREMKIDRNVAADADRAVLLQALKRAQPPCPFFATKQGCRKGRKCKLAHGGENEDHIPHISCHVLGDGNSYITLRPPLMQGLERFFKDRNCPMPMSNG